VFRIYPHCFIELSGATFSGLGLCLRSPHTTKTSSASIRRIGRPRPVSRKTIAIFSGGQQFPRKTEQLLTLERAWPRRVIVQLARGGRGISRKNRGVRPVPSARSMTPRMVNQLVLSIGSKRPLLLPAGELVAVEASRINRQGSQIEWPVRGNRWPLDVFCVEHCNGPLD